MKKLGFIGTGNMAGAIIRAAAKTIGGQEIIISNRTRAKADVIGKEIECQVVDHNKEVAKAAKYVVLGVKPQMMEGVLNEIKDIVIEESLKRELIIVTMAAGHKIEFYKRILGETIPIIRIMPNTPAVLGLGMTTICGSSEVTVAQLEDYMAMTKESGKMQIIPESQFDAAGTVAGCTTAWAYMFIEALSDGGVATGLPRPDALRYAAQAVMGAAAMVLETGKHPGQLKDEVCSPGGTTIIGVKALEDRGFRGAVMSAVMDAVERTSALRK